ncbi:hypothetical protein [Evansella clarkii]|uniref:hypothetical protein n=1 Tax=Evansella clarkii TaxID=79879 RepID=UPI0009969ED1|nr:hypothetical protein [Evansella clarkii]
MSGKKRKRRSFWEPDSEKLISWLDEQSDLGTSLQLIIVDAIHKYGEGDVIKAHLNQRENAYYTGEPESPVRKPVQKSAPTIEQEQEPASTPAPQIKEEAIKPPASEPEDHQDVSKGPERETEPKLEQEPELEPELDEESHDEMGFDIDDMMAGNADTDTEKKESDYDPLTIMMGDIGSTLSK